MALRLLVDTCVWLDLAKDHRERPVISALETLIESGEIELIVPQQVVDEFDRNKSRIISEVRRGYQTHFRMVRQAVNQFSDDESKGNLLEGLKEIDRQMTVTGDAVGDSIERIETLLRRNPALATSDAIKQRVTDRALAKLAPYHRSNNSVGDAIIIEIYADTVSNADCGASCAFITHNTNDFSDANGDKRRPHQDIAHLFDAQRSFYWTSMVGLLNDQHPDVLAEEDIEFNYSQEARRLSEILDTEYQLSRKVWYNRHQNLRSRISNGTLKVVPEAEYNRGVYRPDLIIDSIWAGALAAAKRTEEELGIHNLGPWSDFEWGMINGKLSALRWVLGDEWDMLDT